MGKNSSTVNGIVLNCITLGLWISYVVLAELNYLTSPHTHNSFICILEIRAGVQGLLQFNKRRMFIY